MQNGRSGRNSDTEEGTPVSLSFNEDFIMKEGLMKSGFITGIVLSTCLGFALGTGTAQIYQFSGRVYDGAVGVETTPLSGVTVTLYGANNSGELSTIISSTTTNASGWYGLSAVRTSWEYYNIVETDPSGYNSTGAKSVDGSVLNSNQIQYASPVDGKTLTGNKFYDQKPQQAENNPPVAEAGGPYYTYPGLPVTLDGSASYDPDSGDKIVQYEWSWGYSSGAQTPINGIMSVPTLNWVPPAAITGTVILKVTDTHGATDTDTADLLPEVERTGAVYGTKFNDENGNGLWDNVESGMAGWTITLTGSGVPVSTTTGSDGTYSFTNLAPGDYTVSETGQAGWTQTCPASPGTYSVQVAAGQGVSGRDFGNTQSTVQQGEMDYGDAPLPYPEASGSLGGSWLGDITDSPDAESGMQRDPQALGDDHNGLDDENCLEFVGGFLSPGSVAIGKFIFHAVLEPHENLTVGWWIDFNGDGSWNQTEKVSFVLQNTTATSYVADVPIIGPLAQVPGTAKIGKTFARVRIMDGMHDPFFPDGPGGSGEVEDFEVEIREGGTPVPPGGILGGFKYDDQNGNGAWDTGEPGLADWEIWLDMNGNAVSDPGEPKTTTDSNGIFVFTGLADGNYLVNETLQSGWVQTYPGSPASAFPYGVTLKNGWLDPFVSILFGNCRTSAPGGGKGAVKWNQAPLFHPDYFDEKCYFGWGEPSTDGAVTIADDWFCYNNRPVTSITWWGTYAGWDSAIPPDRGPDLFHIAIWTDTSVTDTRPWRHPGRMIRDWFVPRDMAGEQADRDHRMPEWMNPQPDTTFRYSFSIPQPAWFQQPGDSTRFWISISAVYPEPPGENIWGWLTRERYFGADAVRVFAPAAPRPDSTFREGDPLPEFRDMAFVLGTDENTAVMDFGDAIDGLGTTWSHNGAHHLIRHDVVLGGSIDMETDGTPDVDALGDDNQGMDDEDGVDFLSALKPGSLAEAAVRVSIRGFLNAWLDRNRNGVWDPGEQAIHNLELEAGNQVVKFPVTDDALPGNAVMRFRFCTRPDVWVKGFAPDGEVEDYIVEISQPGTGIEAREEAPRRFHLYPNFPNPFNPGTTIRFDLPDAALVRLAVYDLLGREIAVLADGRLDRGVRDVRWNGLDGRNHPVPTGVYLYRLDAGFYHGTGKLLLMK
jgi:hypothetical protein